MLLFRDSEWTTKFSLTGSINKIKIADPDTKMKMKNINKSRARWREKLMEVLLLKNLMVLQYKWVLH